MPTVVCAEEGPLRTNVDRIHHGSWSELEIALLVDEDLAEVPLAQAMSGLVGRDRLDSTLLTPSSAHEKLGSK